MTAALRVAAVSAFFYYTCYYYESSYLGFYGFDSTLFAPGFAVLANAGGHVLWAILCFTIVEILLGFCFGWHVRSYIGRAQANVPYLIANASAISVLTGRFLSLRLTLALCAVMVIVDLLRIKRNPKYRRRLARETYNMTKMGRKWFRTRKISAESIRAGRFAFAAYLILSFASLGGVYEASDKVSYDCFGNNPKWLLVRVHNDRAFLCEKPKGLVLTGRLRVAPMDSLGGNVMTVVEAGPLRKKL